MININLICIIFLSFLTFVSHIAIAKEGAGWSTTGRDLYEKCKSPDDTVVHACGEYILGVMDGVIAALPANAQLFCPPANISFFQLEAAYGNWAKENSEFLAQSRLKATVNALSAAFPCRR